MSKNYDRFIELLEEMFQFSNEDLDFGIYRIMNQKRGEIRNFLETGLLPQVKQSFQKYQSADQSQLRKDLEQMRQSLEAAGVPPESAPKYLLLKEQLSKSLDLNALESEVFSDLTSFFRRYYNTGDFVSNRRYKKDVYSIPYEGEEVKLHWANADQYYVKTTENFRNYSFDLPSKRKVHFTLVEASTEQNNNKEQEGKERQFILTEEQPLEEIGDELFIRFEYRSMDDKVKREALNAQSIDRISRMADFQGWLQELQKPHDKNPNKTILEKHLNDYTASNKFDYFIHKDLGGFLRRELDFFIKNEIIHLDDLDTENEARIEQYLSKIKVIKSIGHKIINFLEQIENFQKKLWLKKKFVVDTQYCVTLDRVPEELYSEIATNEAQLDEWIRLFAIDEITGDLTSPAFIRPLTVGFLKANPYLVLDTRFFDQVFKDKLLMSIEDLDEQMDGLLVHSENFQAMNFLNNYYAEKIKCLFIDPPYNTGGDGFLYRDNYQHSSWLSMMDNRLKISKKLLSKQGLFFSAIDYVEVSNLRLLCDQIFGESNFLADIAWEKRYTRSNNAKKFYSLKDTVLAYRASGSVNVLREGRSEKSKENYTNPDNDSRGPWISSSYVNPATKEERPNLVYAITNSVTGETVEHPTHAWKYDKDTHEQHVKDKRLYWGQSGSNEYPRLKTFLSEAKDGMVPIDVWHYKETGTTDDGGNIVKNLFSESVFSNPKPPSLVQRAFQLEVNDSGESIMMDFFAGSGTTGHAVINLNREDNGSRKYILVEMGEYFKTVTKPRIQKVIYSKDWKDGKPVSREGSSHMFKYIRLESYEDTLNNLSLRRSNPQQLALDKMEAEAKEQYLLSYMLDLESKGSASLIDLSQFENPFEYKLKTVQNNQTQVANVDLIETFNYLLGLVVKQVEALQGFKVVRGMLATGENVLIIWRNLKEKSNEDLEAFFKKQRYSTLDTEFDRIYVNGDNHLENLKQDEDHWKVILIEEEFQRLMFDVADV